MKYCEECGNELKEGYAFCDKCGTKVKAREDKKEKKEEKKEEVKEEKLEKVVEERPIPPKPPRPPKEKGRKGLVIFLSILNVILLAAAITFLVLWLTKSSETKSNYSSKKDGPDVVDPEPNPKDSNKFVGKWEQNVQYVEDGKVVQETYGLIEIKNDKSFKALFYDKDDKAGTKEEIEGTYIVSGDSITLKWKEDGEYETETLDLEGKKLCLDYDCENYLVKDSYNNKIVIDYDDDDDDTDIKFISYAEYEKIQKDYEDAIVVVVRDGCSWCEKFESVVEDITYEYDTPVYYYENDGKIKVNGTPTTIIIKNGYIVKTVDGYKDFDSMEEILDDLGVK